MLTTLSAGMIGFALVVYTLTNPKNERCLECGGCCGRSGTGSHDGLDIELEGGAKHSAVRCVREGYSAVPTTDGVILSGAAASAAAAAVNGLHRSTRRAVSGHNVLTLFSLRANFFFYLLFSTLTTYLL